MSDIDPQLRKKLEDSFVERLADFFIKKHADYVTAATTQQAFTIYPDSDASTATISEWGGFLWTFLQADMRNELQQADDEVGVPGSWLDNR